QRELVSLAMLTLLEGLSPIERAVFVLREAFGYPHAEIAGLLDLTEANCQQLYHRARQRVRVDHARFVTPPERARELFERFLAAARTGDVAALERLFADDIVATADGGGKVNAARRPVVGAHRVAIYVAWLFGHDVPGLEVAVEEVNGAPAVIARVHGEALVIVSIDATEAGVAAVWVLVNPDKLAYFQRVDA
ncbi:sigma factor-like helix-turn-helix DNA-binding protein, partial [Nocardia gipuzkoensis]